MVKPKPQDRAWDADALIGWLGEEGDKMPECEPVIRWAEQGKVRIIVSTLAMVEVIKLKRHVPVPKAAQDRIDAFFQRTFLIVRNVDPATARLARELVWNNGINPKDAVHVATALRANAQVLDTFDKALIGRSPLEVAGFKPLVIGRPHIEGYQPELGEEASEPPVG